MYKLGQKSINEMRDPNKALFVHPNLVAMVEGSIIITPVDFSVHDGLRTLDEQREYVRTGVSKTLNSYHIPNIPRNKGERSEYGQAVDLVPYINGKLRWEWDPIFQIAAAMHSNLDKLDNYNKIRWGAVWDRTLDQLDPMQLEAERDAYIKRRRQQGKKAFTDGPHFQIELHRFSGSVI
jgi:peptidoglycan L-alanyl-D-glutamate endopeptidase CwlK